MPADAELEAIFKVQSALESLDDFARRRVLRWADERYGLSVAAVVEKHLKEQVLEEAS